MARLSPFLWFVLLVTACRTGTPLLAKRTPHEQYGKKLADAGLDVTAMGRQWFAAADRALNQPQSIPLPYREAGYFPAGEPRAVGLQFNVKRGQRVQFRIERNPIAAFQLYTELYEVSGGNRTLVNPDGIEQGNFSYDADRDHLLLLRMQPELLQSGEYNLVLSLGPSLGFPVSGSSAKIGSFWGADRDGGSRRHEGIDIFAPKGTPAIASEDGVVTSVREGGLGGKVVFMRPKGRDINLYYAHLDSQLVTERQRVSKGDTLGLVGNTGNARNTPAHLHFGIYGTGGAVDPLPFVDRDVRVPGQISFSRTVLNGWMRLKNPQTIRTVDGSSSIVYPTNTIFRPWTLGSGYVIGQFPDDRLALVPATATQVAESEIRLSRIRQELPLLERPVNGSPRKGNLDKDIRIEILGYYKEFAFVRFKTSEGWIPTAAL